MSEPSRFALTLPAEQHAVGDLWRVESVSTDERPELRFLVFERVKAEPDQYRARGDGLWPPLPAARPVSPEEAKAIADQMDAAMSRCAREAVEAMREHNQLVTEAIERELRGEQPSPFADLDSEGR